MAPPTRGSAREDRIESRHFYYCHIAVDTHMGSGYTLYTRRNERSECKQSWKVCLSDALVRPRSRVELAAQWSFSARFFSLQPKIEKYYITDNFNQHWLIFNTSPQREFITYLLFVLSCSNMSKKQVGHKLIYRYPCLIKSVEGLIFPPNLLGLQITVFVIVN